MKDISLYSRREFTKTFVFGLGGASLLFNCSEKISRWRYFTEGEAELVVAICEQIIPADQDPGATDAFVVNFIDKQLISHYERHQNMYRVCLGAFQKSTNTLFGKNFQSLDWETQTTMLKQTEQGDVPGEHWAPYSPGQFFRMIRDHSMQGFYGNPRHGGNKDFASYRMIGMSYPQIIGQNRYRWLPDTKVNQLEFK